MSPSSRYRPVRRVADGSVSDVLLASQHALGGLERLVILKRLRADLDADPMIREIFIHSARVAATLDHPHIITAFDALAEEGEPPSLVLEHLSGETLRVILDAAAQIGARITSPVACRIVADVASALAYAVEQGAALHGAPLVHGDVTPSNVMISYEGVTKLLDFGLLRAPESLALQAGCVAYSAPEQLNGAPASPLGDVFSLGALLYELLTGARLFEGAGLAQVTQAVLSKPIDPPSAHAEGISPALDQIVLDALARDPARRTPSARVLHQQLEEALRATRQGVSAFRLSEWLKDLMGPRYEARLSVERLALSDARAAPLPLDALPALGPLHTSPRAPQRRRQAAARPQSRPRRSIKPLAWAFSGLGLLATLLWIAYLLGQSA